MSVSAVVLAYGRQRMLNRTLRCLLNQTTPLHEIIVVDNGSLKPLTVPNGVRLLRIDDPSAGGGTSEAKNRGAALATGDHLLFSYDDTIHLPDAVECVLARASQLSHTDSLINVLTVSVRYGSHMPDEASLYRDAADCDSEMIRATLRGYRGGLCFEQHCGLISRSFFTRIGGYDTRHFKSWGLNDQDLCLSVIAHGGIVNCDVNRADGRPLFCFHQFGARRCANPQKAAQRDAEFRAKYGYGWEDAWERRWAHRQLTNMEKTACHAD